LEILRASLAQLFDLGLEMSDTLLKFIDVHPWVGLLGPRIGILAN